MDTTTTHLYLTLGGELELNITSIKLRYLSHLKEIYISILCNLSQKKAFIFIWLQKYERLYKGGEVLYPQLGVLYPQPFPLRGRGAHFTTAGVGFIE